MIRSFLLLFTLHTCLLSALSQQQDFGTWTYFNIHYKITENWSVGYTDHQLTHENASEPWMLLHDFSISQKLNAHLSHELHYRYIQFQKLNDVFEDRSLFYYAMNGSWSWNDWQLSARSRWQSLAYGSHWNDEFKGPYYYHRMKISLGKKINYHWKYSWGLEIFQPIHRPGRKGIDQFRTGPNLIYRWNKNWSFDLFYQYQKQLQRKNPYSYFLIGLGINLTL